MTLHIHLGPVPDAVLSGEIVRRAVGRELMGYFVQDAARAPVDKAVEGHIADLRESVVERFSKLPLYITLTLSETRAVDPVSDVSGHSRYLWLRSILSMGRAFQEETEAAMDLAAFPVAAEFGDRLLGEPVLADRVHVIGPGRPRTGMPVSEVGRPTVGMVGSESHLPAPAVSALLANLAAAVPPPDAPQAVGDFLASLAEPDAIARWHYLWLAFERIQRAVGGEAALKARTNVVATEVERFKRTANSPLALGTAARHVGRPGESPPVRPMALQDAERFVAGLLADWIG